MPRGQIIARNSTTWLVRLCQDRDPATAKTTVLKQARSRRTRARRGRVGGTSLADPGTRTSEFHTR